MSIKERRIVVTVIAERPGAGHSHKLWGTTRVAPWAVLFCPFRALGHPASALSTATRIVLI
jgi:hypothetical protein